MRAVPLLVLSFFATLNLNAQLVSSNAIPKGPNPPVVFLNGYQADCRGSNFAGTFGKFDSVLQAQNRTSIFFDNCAFTTLTKPSIEELGNTFGAYLGSLRYTDGTMVPTVDVVAHSMGGLIIRSYLAGKQLGGGFTPPATVPIRKAIFIATPNFGTPVTGGLAFDTQLQELTSGSQFLFDLATWNQGTDDLRNVDAFAIAGNGGSGQATGMPRFDDGVVSLASASIGFARPNRTRILPLCHTGSGPITLVALCPSNTAGVASVTGPNDIPARLVVSFLADTADYNVFGQATAENEFLFDTGGAILRLKSNTGQYLPITKATSSDGNLTIRSSAVAYSDYFPLPNQTFTLSSNTISSSQALRVASGTVTARYLKDGPVIGRVLPSAANVSPLAVGSNSYISIYGTGLDQAQVTSGSTMLTVLATSPTQVNAVLTADPTKAVVPVTVTNAAGSDTINVYTRPNVPALFTQNASGSGPASALNAVTNILVSPAAPLRAADYVSLYLTGLTVFLDPVTGTNVSKISVTVGGRDCPVQFAGVAPGYTVLDQINCQIPVGISSTTAPVIVTVDGQISNTATLAVQ